MALRDYRVIEIGGGSALAYCGKLFADFAAEVIKIEPPGGDPGRLEPPLVDAGGHMESAYFAWANTSKRSIIADLDDPVAVRRIADLAGGADVLLDSRPAAQQQAGPLAHAALRAYFPQLTITAISWFGEDGPYRDYLATDATCRALAGLVSLVGPREKPVVIADHQADIIGALTAFVASLAGLHAGGRRFSVSLHEACTVLCDLHTPFGPAGPRQRLGINRFSTGYPGGIFKCREGWIGISAYTPPQWASFCDLFDLPQVLANPKYATGPDRVRHRDELEPLFASRFAERTATEWHAEALKRRLAFAIVPTMAEVLQQEVHLAAGAFVSVRIGEATFQAPRLPLNLTLTPPRRGGVAPLAGADQAYELATPTRVASVPAAPALPLAGMRIVDFSMGWAGPLATRQLADLGAEVIKVESCQHPDWWRGADNRPVFVEQLMYEMRPNFLIENRNKLGITLNLSSPEGAALARRLVARADAVVENFARGAMTKLGLDYAALRVVRPDLVMLSMPAFPSGPWEQGRAYGFTLEQAVGMPTIAGTEGAPPMLTHCAFGDPISGLNGAAALLTALLHRKRTGEGQLIDLAQIHCMLPMIAPWLIAQSVDGDSGPRRGNRHPVHAPHDCYPCLGEDQWVWIAVTDDTMWQRLCRVTGLLDLARFTCAADRHAHADAIDEALADWTRLRTADDAMQILQSATVAAGVVRSPFDLAADPHLLATGFFQPTEHPCYGPHQQPSLSLRESATPYPVRRRSPLLGEHNTEVLGEILGLSATELAALAECQVIGTVPILQGE